MKYLIYFVLRVLKFNNKNRHTYDSKTTLYSIISIYMTQHKLLYTAMTVNKNLYFNQLRWEEETKRIYK